MPIELAAGRSSTFPDPRIVTILVAFASGCMASPSGRGDTVVSAPAPSGTRRDPSRCELLAEGRGPVADPAGELSFAAIETRSVLLVGEERFELDAASGFSSRREASGRSVVFALGGAMHVAGIDGDSVAIDGEASEESPPLSGWDRAPIRAASGAHVAVLPFRGSDGIFAPLFVSSIAEQSTFLIGRGPGTMAAATSDRAVALAHRVEGGIEVIRVRGGGSLHEAGRWEIPTSAAVSDPLVAFIGPRIVVVWTEVDADARSTAKFAVVTPHASIEVHPLAGSDSHVEHLALGSDEGRPILAWIESERPGAASGMLVIAGLDDSLASFGAMRVDVPLVDAPDRLELVVDGASVHLATVTDSARWVDLSRWRCDQTLPPSLAADVPDPPPVHVSVEEPTEADCASPADCDGRRACVTNALGGRLGCTGERCCGASECVNGCLTDADCPSCRPECARSPDGAAGTCRNPNGP